MLRSPRHRHDGPRREAVHNGALLAALGYPESQRNDREACETTSVELRSPDAKEENESMKETTRRAWSRPELVVLVRSRPEESVLTACKSWAGQKGHDSINYACLALSGPCTDCNAIPDS